MTSFHLQSSRPSSFCHEARPPLQRGRNALAHLAVASGMGQHTWNPPGFPLKLIHKWVFIRQIQYSVVMCSIYYSIIVLFNEQYSYSPINSIAYKCTIFDIDVAPHLKKIADNTSRKKVQALGVFR